VIESPESDNTTVIYLTSTPVGCVDLSFSGWDRMIGAGTSILQLKVPGMRPGRYRVVMPPTEATAKWMQSEGARPSSEMDSEGGWISVDAVSARGAAMGTFVVDFAAGRLAGTFNANFCPNGHEP
jgi:hypothetical protein